MGFEGLQPCPLPVLAFCFLCGWKCDQPASCSCPTFPLTVVLPSPSWWRDFYFSGTVAKISQFFPTLLLVMAFYQSRRSSTQKSIGKQNLWHTHFNPENWTLTLPSHVLFKGERNTQWRGDISTHETNWEHEYMMRVYLCVLSLTLAWSKDGRVF